MQVDQCSEPTKKPSRERLLEDYRNSMAGYLGESLRMIQRSLSAADFERGFPNIFGQPTEENPEVFVQNSCGLLLRKAQFHMMAALLANKSSNLHSLTVQMRVILECAAQIVATANSACEGSEKAVAQAVNRFEKDYQSDLARMSRGQLTPNEIQEEVIQARPESLKDAYKLPKKETLADKMAVLPYGESWYSYLSDSFCKSDPSNLEGPSFRGGVLSINSAADVLTFATLLDYLAAQVIRMLVGYGFILIAVTTEDQPFNNAIQLSERKKSASIKIKNTLSQQEKGCSK